MSPLAASIDVGEWTTTRSNNNNNKWKLLPLLQARELRSSPKLTDELCCCCSCLLLLLLYAYDTKPKKNIETDKKNLKI